MSLFDWLRICCCFTLVCGDKVFLLDTLNATAELGWSVYSNQESGDEWQEETYRADTLNLNNQAFSTCLVEHANLENWLFLPRLTLSEANRLFFEIKFTMRKCQEIPTARTTCKETLKLYALPTRNESDFPQENWHLDRRWDFVDTIATNNDDKSQVYVQTLTYATKLNGLNFAIKDEGACSSILYIKVYYEVCPPSTTFLTHFPRTVPDQELNAVKKVVGKCSQNATITTSNFKKPISLCKSDGTWQMLTGECECVAGFIPSKNTNTCAPCGVGSFKVAAGEGECTPCPRNSFTDQLGSTACECEINFYRPFGTDITAPCIPVETSTNQTSISSNVFFKSEDNALGKSQNPPTLQISREVLLVLATILVSILICGFMIVIFVHQRNLPKNKHQSDLDVLEHYKQGSMTPDYGHLTSNGTFPAFQGDYARKINVPLIPAAYGTPRYGMTNRFRPYVDPTTYEDPTEALAEFANEIAPENVEVTRTIGVGEFGEVCSGRLRVEDNHYGGVVQQIVAVKTLLPGSSIKAKSDFLMEASIMGQFDHPNVVHLIGVVTKTEPVMILTEYMLNGSLDKFLQSNDNGRLCTLQLIQMMCDIANGMKYLCDKGYVHRDLAARNILVDDRLTCKISDFGLSRGVSTEDHEYTTQGGKIPIRWTSPEAISHRKYTAASDVWSFGICIWEILSFGERPYWDWTNHKVIESVQNGFRLPKPIDAPDCLHEIMLKCWQSNRHLRPTFDQLCQQLNSILVYYSNHLEIANQPCNELNVSLLPLTDPPVLSITDFLRLNNLSKCIPVMERNNVHTVDELRRLNCRELIMMGLDEVDARQILTHLTRPHKSNYEGVSDSFNSFCVHRNEAMNQVLNEHQQLTSHATTLQHPVTRPPARCSPLLSASSISTNQTVVTSNSNISTNKIERSARRSTLGEEGFFV